MPAHQNEAQFQRVQRLFAAQIREPSPGVAASLGIDERRLAVYQELMFNNVSSFIAGGFPVVRSLYDDLAWQVLMRQFLQRHACRTPYFLEIGREFLEFLASGHVPTAVDPPFLQELAHYEWVELALEVADAEIPADVAPALAEDDSVLQVSPLAWPLVYQYPVHKIDASFRPAAPDGTPVCLLVYRNRADRVEFMETNPITVHLLQSIEQAPQATARQLLQQLAADVGSEDADAFVAYGLDLLESLRSRGVVVALPVQAAAAR